MKLERHARSFDVTVVGELNLDLVLYGLPEVLAPGRELLAKNLALTLGSSSAIFAHNLSVLGTRVGFISRIGNDPLGQMAVDQLAAGGVDVCKVRRIEGATMTGLSVIIPVTPTRYTLTYPGTMDEMCYDDLDLEYLADAKHFHLSSFFLHKALRARIPELFRRMKEAGLTTSLDTNDDPEDGWADDLFETLNYVDVFFPNEHEAKRIARTDDLDLAMGKLGEKVPLLAVKMGSSGAIVQRGSERICTPAPQVDFVDSIGAGDSFDAGFLHQYLQGAGIKTCLEYGNLAGAFSTTRPGGTEAFRDPKYFDGFFRQRAT
jgi:sugar/nucleoside kinase (ribokinase family)